MKRVLPAMLSSLAADYEEWESERPRRKSSQKLLESYAEAVSESHHRRITQKEAFSYANVLCCFSDYNNDLRRKLSELEKAHLSAMLGLCIEDLLRTVQFYDRAQLAVKLRIHKSTPFKRSWSNLLKDSGNGIALVSLGKMLEDVNRVRRRTNKRDLPLTVQDLQKILRCEGDRVGVFVRKKIIEA